MKLSSGKRFSLQFSGELYMVVSVLDCIMLMLDGYGLKDLFLLHNLVHEKNVLDC